MDNWKPEKEGCSLLGRLSEVKETRFRSLRLTITGTAPDGHTQIFFANNHEAIRACNRMQTGEQVRISCHKVIDGVPMLTFEQKLAFTGKYYWIPLGGHKLAFKKIYLDDMTHLEGVPVDLGKVGRDHFVRMVVTGSELVSLPIHPKQLASFDWNSHIRRNRLLIESLGKLGKFNERHFKITVF